MMELIYYAFFGCLMTYASPVISIRTYIQDLLPDKMWSRTLFYMLSCALCFTWWLTLVLTLSPFQAAFSALLAEILYRFLKYFNPI
jgi:hypothetical protein